MKSTSRTRLLVRVYDEISGEQIRAVRRAARQPTAKIGEIAQGPARGIEMRKEINMIQMRKAGDRGHFDHGWLKTYHTFSFGDYYDPAHMGFRSLRVINEDRVQPGQGFGTHGHRDMEIITCVLEGALQHQDSLGNGSVIKPGELQRMSAGTGIRHSEFNPSDTEWVHLYQIWLLPERKGLKPSYEQRSFNEEESRGRLRLVASPDGADGSLTIQQDARLYLASLAQDQAVAHAMADGRSAWLQVLRGNVALNGHALSQGDGAAVSDEEQLQIESQGKSEIMLFDLA
jgi:quercetin 2,3-dioxygenase